MSKDRKHVAVQLRNEGFVDKVETKVSCDLPDENNPYLAKRRLTRGYDLVDLMQNASYIEVLYLLFRGELPDEASTRLLEKLNIALMNPGVRHPATRAAMNVAVGKTNPAHILPVGAALLSGEYQGGAEIENAMRFIRKNQRKNIEQVLETLDAISESSANAKTIPGFGSIYSDIDPIAQSVSSNLLEVSDDDSSVAWGCKLAARLNKKGIGWLMPGVAAAVYCDLGFQPRAGLLLFQLMSSPGVLAHSVELTNRPRTAMPFVKDQNYTIKPA